MHVTIVHLPLGQLGASGIAIAFPVATAELVDRLPRPRTESGVLIVRVPGRAAAACDGEGRGADEQPLQPVPRQFAVRLPLLMAALRWLQANNPLYAQVTLRPLDPGEEEAINAEAADAAAADTEQAAVMAHGVVLPDDPAAPVDALQQQLNMRPARDRRPQQETLYFDLRRSTGQPASILTSLVLEVRARSSAH